MIVRTADYRSNFDWIKNLLTKHPDCDLINEISSAAVFSHVPLLVVFTYAQEIFPDKDFSKEIEKLKLFYKVSKII